MAQHGNLMAAGIALALILSPAIAEGGMIDSFKQSWSEIGGKPSSKKSSVDTKKMNTGATGCMEAVLEAKARGGTGVDVTAACAQGANKSLKEAEAQEAREEQELLARKDAETWGRRIDHVNERIIDRQPRIERIISEKEGDAPPKDESEIVMDKKCRADASCREAVIAAETGASSPGFFAGIWYSLFPSSAPKARAELKGIERDVSFLARSIDEIKVGIEETEENFYTASNVKQKSGIAKDKGVLISQLSQATQALAVLKTQRGELEKGYLAYVLMVLAAIGATIVKKLSDGAVSFSLDGAKRIVKKVRRRRKDEPEKQHSMY